MMMKKQHLMAETAPWQLIRMKNKERRKRDMGRRGRAAACDESWVVQVRCHRVKATRVNAHI